MHPSIFRERIHRLQQKMPDDAILFLPAAPPRVRSHDTHYRYRGHSDILYLTGINEAELSLIITRDALHLCAQKGDPQRERWTGKVCGHDFLRARFAGGGFTVEVHDAGEWEKTLAEQVISRKLLYYDFGFNAEIDHRVFTLLHELNLKSRRGIVVPRTVVRAGEILAPMRLIKDEHDLLMLRRAAAISAEAHNVVQDFISSAEGELSEFTVKALIEHEFLRRGAEHLAYPSIVAAGKNATILHYEGSRGSARTGEFILVDAGAELDGYASDITRTTAVGGNEKTDALRRELRALVLTAQREAIALARPGITIDEVHQKAVTVLAEGLLAFGFFRNVPERKDGKENPERLVAVSSLEEIIKEEYYTYYYMHKTSHYLGLDVHDVGDYYVDGKSRMLEPGMVITVEPGLYFPPEYSFLPQEVRGIGIRIEDDVLITATGNEVLTKACKV
ncbi:MAG: aminopeptidase P N-terminal domain-containing protein [Turneriella sp.]|nr:aminopeptidase P N-terminal domain-containing protein [Turneriella sp.]